MMLRRKTDPKTGAHTLREPAQAKCTWRFRNSHYIQKFTGKMPRRRLSPERRHTLCASLRSRNACQDFTRATLCLALAFAFTLALAFAFGVASTESAPGAASVQASGSSFSCCCCSFIRIFCDSDAGNASKN